MANKRDSESDIQMNNSHDRQKDGGEDTKCYAEGHHHTWLSYNTTGVSDAEKSGARITETPFI